MHGQSHLPNPRKVGYGGFDIDQFSMFLQKTNVVSKVTFVLNPEESNFRSPDATIFSPNALWVISTPDPTQFGTPPF